MATCLKEELGLTERMADGYFEKEDCTNLQAPFEKMFSRIHMLSLAIFGRL